MIEERLKKVILSELGLEDYDIEPETTASMLPGWDSLRHLAILGAIEREYGTRFKTREVLRLRCVGDLQQLLQEKALVE